MLTGRLAFNVAGVLDYTVSHIIVERPTCRDRGEPRRELRIDPSGIFRNAKMKDIQSWSLITNWEMRIHYLNTSIETFHHEESDTCKGRCTIRSPDAVGAGSRPPRMFICSDGWISRGAGSVSSRLRRISINSASRVPSFRCLFSSLCCLTVKNGTGAHRPSGG